MTKRLGVLCGLLGVVVLAALGSRWLVGSATPPQGETRPPGWWLVDRTRDSDLQDYGRTLSLPYSQSTGLAAGGKTGVVFVDSARVAAGYNLVVSGHDAMVFLLSSEGEVLWRWRVPYRQAFPKLRGSGETGCFRRARLLDDGSIIGLYQGGGLVRIDRDSQVLWANSAAFYNDVRISPEGQLLSLVKKARPGFRDSSAQVLEDFAVEVDLATGETLSSVSILDSLAKSEWSWVLDSVGTDPDILHSNTILRIPARESKGVQGLTAGNLLVSLREIDSLVALDQTSGELVWFQQGPWRRQHEPSFLPDGQLMVFDNRGGVDGSRVLVLDPESGEVETLFEGLEINSEQAGSSSRLPNGNTLITESYRGQAFEISEQGEVVWHYINPFRTGESNEFKAVLFEILRVPEARWISQTD